MESGLASRENSLSIQYRQSFRLGEVVHRVGIEEGIERLGWPRHGGKLVARGPTIDLADVFDDKRVAEFFT